MKLNTWNDDRPYLSVHELLKKRKSIHQRNLQFLTNGIFRGKEWGVCWINRSIFQLINKHNDLQNNSILLRKRKRTVFLKNKKPFYFSSKILGNNTMVTLKRNCSITIQNMDCLSIPIQVVFGSYWFHLNCSCVLYLFKKWF